jgi:uncharacterized protein (DUF2147 family)
MKDLLLTFFTSFVFLSVANAQVTGLWKSTDHIDDTERSIVRIYEFNGMLYGRIEKLLPAATITKCVGCEGDQKNKSLTGMVIISDLKKNASGGSGGKILDPSNGKWYSCDIVLESTDQLKVTGYLGLPLLGKTMYWNRLK